MISLHTFIQNTNIRVTSLLGVASFDYTTAQNHSSTVTTPKDFLRISYLDSQNLQKSTSRWNEVHYFSNYNTPRHRCTPRRVSPPKVFMASGPYLLSPLRLYFNYPPPWGHHNLSPIVAVNEQEKCFSSAHSSAALQCKDFRRRTYNARSIRLTKSDVFILLTLLERQAVLHGSCT